MLHGLGILNKKVVFGLCNEYEDCLRFLNGLIRTMETSTREPADRETTTRETVARANYQSGGGGGGE